MRLHYSVSFEDFKTLQPPFVLRPGNNAGFKGVLVACASISLLGVFCLMRGFGWQVGVFLIGLGTIAAAVAYLYDKRSVRKAQEQREHKLAVAYQRVHCRNERFFETDEKGFTARCQCGAVTRPWSELTGFSESPTHVALGAKSAWQVIPKSAFPSPAAITEFRTLVSEKVNRGKQVTARHIDFKCSPDDFRRARRLHILRAGGWRGLAKALATSACAAYGCFIIGRAAHNPAITAGLMGGILGIPLLKLASKRRKLQIAPVRIYFDENGLYPQGPMTQTRKPWTEFVGYLEDSELLLIYSSPRVYRIIPKRALVGSGTELEKMIKTKLSQYNYRKPLLAQASSAVQQVS